MAWIQLLSFLESSGWVKWSLPWAGIGLVCLLVEKDRADRKFIVATLLGFSLLAFAAAFYFSLHYFIVMLPVVSLLIAISVTTATQALAGARLAVVRLAPAILFVAAGAAFVVNQRAVWFQMSPEEVCRAVYGRNPFVESVEVGRYLKEHTAPDARIAVIGSEPQIYFYAHRHSASGFIYMYDLVQLHHYAGQFQRDMIGEIEAARPQYLVMVLVSSSWSDWPGADPRNGVDDTHASSTSGPAASIFTRRAAITFGTALPRLKETTRPLSWMCIRERTICEDRHRLRSRGFRLQGKDQGLPARVGP
jgi:hypothetical protein